MDGDGVYQFQFGNSDRCRSVYSSRLRLCSDLGVSVQAILLILFFIVSLLAISKDVIAASYQLGDLAPRSGPDGVIDVADLLVLHDIISGDIASPTSKEIAIADLAPVGAPDGVINVADVLLMSQAISGQVVLGTVVYIDPPTLDQAGGYTNDNPYPISGITEPGLMVEVYVNDELYRQTTSDSVTGVFATTVALLDGQNEVYVIATDGSAASDPTDTLIVDYDNNIPRSQSGTISSDTVWTPGLSAAPYTIASTLSISSDATLTLQPGVIVEFASGQRLEVNAASLIVNGTSDQPVLFRAAPNVSSWNGIRINNGAIDVELNYVVVEDAGAGLHFNNSGNVGVVSNSVFKNNSIGIRVEDISSPFISDNNEITENQTGIDVKGGSIGVDLNPSPIVTGNRIYNNSLNNYRTSNFYNASAVILDATGNWWGSVDPVVMEGSIRHGNDSSTAATVNYSFFLETPFGPQSSLNVLVGTLQPGTILSPSSEYVVAGNIFVASGDILTIQAGVALAFPSGTRLDVSGKINIQGMVDDPVVLTSAEAEPEVGDWGGVRINSASIDSLIDYAVIEWSSIGVLASGATNVVVTNSIISRFETYGVSYESVVTGLLDGNLIDNIRREEQFPNQGGVKINYSGDIIISNNAITNNYTGVVIDNSHATLSAPALASNYIYNNRIGVSIDTSNSDPILSSNAILDNDFYGVVIDGTGSDSSNPEPSLIGNDIYGNGNDIYIDGFGAASVIQLNISNNWFGVTIPAYGDEILLSNTPQTVIDINVQASAEQNPDIVKISNVTIDTDTIYPLASDSVGISFDLSAPAQVTLSVSAYDDHESIYHSTQTFQAPGTHVIAWDGKSTSGEMVNSKAYMFTLRAIGLSSGIYSQFHNSKDSAPRSNEGANEVDFDVGKNIIWKLDTTINLPSYITMCVGRTGNPASSTFCNVADPDVFIVYQDVPYQAGVSTIYWDGRDPDGVPVDTSQYGYFFEVPDPLEENTIFVKGTEPSVTGIEMAPNIEVKSNPFSVRHSYDEISDIKYHIDQDSLVTIKLLPPGIFDPSDQSALVLQSQQLLESEIAPGQAKIHSVTWHGYNDSLSEEYRNNILVHEEGLYTFIIEAVGAVSGLTTTYRGSLNLFH